MKVSPGQLCQIEFKVSDLDRSVAFYRRVLGWEPVPAHLHDYVVLAVPEGSPYGVSLVRAKANLGAVGGLVLYFRAENPEEIVKAAVCNGGKELEQRSMPGYGHIMEFADPDGHVIGLFRPQF